MAQEGDELSLDSVLGYKRTGDPYGSPVLFLFGAAFQVRLRGGWRVVIILEIVRSNSRILEMWIFLRGEG